MGYVFVVVVFHRAYCTEAKPIFCTVESSMRGKFWLFLLKTKLSNIYYKGDIEDVCVFA